MDVDHVNQEKISTKFIILPVIVTVGLMGNIASHTVDFFNIDSINFLSTVNRNRIITDLVFPLLRSTPLNYLIDSMIVHF